MSKDIKENELVHFHGPKVSEPYAGHEDTRYEGVDASVKMILYSLVIIAATLIIAAAISLPIQKAIRDTTPVGQPRSPLAPARVVPPAPQLQEHPWEDIQQLRAHEDEILNSYGRDAEGHYRIPIDKAMDAVVARLPIEPNAPVGITIPGGQGRDFSQSLEAMPPAYRRPQIQGEIHKNAQR